MIITGSDSHTSTAGAFNAFAVGIDRTETAGIWKRGETWLRVPESIRINLRNCLKNNVSAKDLALWLIGMIGADGANYLSVEFHGEGIKSLSISDRMTLANMASEMGAKNAVFPYDSVLMDYLGAEYNGIWADKEARYAREIEIDLSEVLPVASAPHNVDNIRSVQELAGTEIHEALIGTCTNGRIEDLRIAADILNNKKIKTGIQLNIIPASRQIYLQAIEEGLISILVTAGANVLTPSCGPCLGTGLGIPASGHTVISTANRNFPGRMGNKDAKIYLASPATVALSALTGKIDNPAEPGVNAKYPFAAPQSRTSVINPGENRKHGKVWDYSDADNLNTDQMFAGKHTYNVMSSDPKSIIPMLFNDFDPSFSKNIEKDDYIIAGDNFGCGSSREHPSAGLAYAGIKAILVKSVNRIFFRSSVNQGLMLIVQPEAVAAYRRGDILDVDYLNSVIRVGERAFRFAPLPPQLLRIIELGGLVNFMKSS
jgi:3-isopropylmalate dehydratase small subunit